MIERVVKLHDLLESCQFRDVWGDEGIESLSEHITHFQEQIRQCMVLLC